MFTFGSYVCSSAQYFASALCTYFPPKPKDYEQIQLTIGSHPLALLYNADDDLIESINDSFMKYCPTLSEEYQLLLQKFQDDEYTQSSLRSKIIEQLTREKYETVKEDYEPKIIETMAQIARTKILDIFDHIPHLLNAMNIHGLIENTNQITFNVWNNEKHVEAGSFIYDLDRPELDLGEIGYINGIMRSFDDAKGDATLLSDNLCQGHNIGCVYSMTHGAVTDLSNTVYGQKGFSPEPVKHLLNQWNTFFHRENNKQVRYLQICMSQGSVMVKLALEQLPEEYRRRICVLAIAPAGFIPIHEGCQVMHFVKMNDIVPVALARGRSRLSGDDPEITKVSSDDGSNPHDPHGQNYIDAIEPYVKRYIETNSIIESKENIN